MRAVDPWQPPWFEAVDEPPSGWAVEQAVEHDLRLKPGQRRPEAEVDPVPKATW